ncbi:MAG: DUF3662 domain-containing protein [Actinobacteria bacterium]|nr:DUF3662 domain-containing protein [Actinomycetota bacterium]
MPTVPILHDFERRLGGLVEGLFAKTFRSGLQPVELAKRILRETDARKTVGVRDVWAPNDFGFSLSPVDAERFEQAEQALVAELQQVVRDHAAERGWGLVGPPRVEFAVDPGLKKGEFHCEASLVEGEEKVEPAPASAASLVITEKGSTRTVRLAGRVVTIGRLPECDVVLKDAGASRRHAQIRDEGAAHRITDLGSTNGTQLNGQPVQSRELADGDRITIGTTVLEFRAGS